MFSFICFFGMVGTLKPRVQARLFPAGESASKDGKSLRLTPPRQKVTSAGERITSQECHIAILVVL